MARSIKQAFLPYMGPFKYKNSFEVVEDDYQMSRFGPFGLSACGRLKTDIEQILYFNCLICNHLRGGYQLG